MKQINRRLHSVYIGNLPFVADEINVMGLFKSYGYIKNIKIIREGKQNKSRGVAFVDMVSKEDAEKAINALNGHEYKGRTLKVSLANNQNFEPTVKTKTPGIKSKPTNKKTPFKLK